MKQVLLIAAGMLFPLATFADVSVSVSVNGPDRQYNVTYKDYGDPWFENEVIHDNGTGSVEYQWSINNARYVLRHRQVFFNIHQNLWSFGPWMILDGYCSPNCAIHHNHQFYHPRRAPNHWQREVIRDKHYGQKYYYVYRPEYNRYNSSGAKVYRYHYRPEIGGHNDNHHYNNQPQYRPDDKHYNRKPEYRSGNGDVNNRQYNSKPDSTHNNNNNHHNQNNRSNSEHNHSRN